MEDSDKQYFDEQDALARAVFSRLYGSFANLKKVIQKGMFEDMNRHLLSVFGLVAFKLVTQELARSTTLSMEDESEKIYRMRQVRESIRMRVIQEWKSVAGRDAINRANNRLDDILPKGIISQELLEEICQDAINEVDNWARKALDMTPTVEDLMEAMGGDDDE